MLTSTDRVWFTAGLGLTEQLEEANMTVHKPPAWMPGNFKNATLSDIKRLGFRFVILMAYDKDTKAIAGQSIKNEMTKGWAWLLTEGKMAWPALVGWLYLRCARDMCARVHARMGAYMCARWVPSWCGIQARATI